MRVLFVHAGELFNQMHVNALGGHWRDLVKALESKGADVEILSRCPEAVRLNAFDCLVHNGLPEPQVWSADLKKVVFLMESPAVCPLEVDPGSLDNKGIFLGWNTNFIGVENFQNVFYSFDLSKLRFKTEEEFEISKLACFIGSNKFSHHYTELYSRRRQLASSLYHREGIDWFGQGWLRKFAGSQLLVRCWNKIDLQQLSLSCSVSSFPKGLIYSGYRFSLAIENSCFGSGYITEKLFDSILAGSIPLYHGGADIEQYVPKELFIDVSNADAEQIYDLISGFNYDDYVSWIKGVVECIKNGHLAKFERLSFIEVSSNAILNEQ